MFIDDELLSMSRSCLLNAESPDRFLVRKGGLQAEKLLMPPSRTMTNPAVAVRIKNTEGTWCNSKI